MESLNNTKVKNYIGQLERVVDGGDWMEVSFSEKLTQVNSQKALKQLIPEKHSIAEILWHCVYWRTVFIKRVQGDKLYKQITQATENWISLDALDYKGWDILKEEFEETQRQIISLLETKTDDFLDEEYEDGYTFDYFLEGIIHHDIYHLGQIGLLISLLEKQNELERIQPGTP